MTELNDSTLVLASATGDLSSDTGARPGRRLFRNTLINGVGGVATLAINFAVIAFAIGRLGSQAYGVWVLALSFSLSAGYLSIADLGLENGIVKFVADAEGSRERERINEVMSSALAVLAVLGVVAILVLLAMAVIATHIFNVPPDLHSALRLLFILLAAEAAFGFPGLAFRGLLAGLQRFPLVQLVDFLRNLAAAGLVVLVLLRGGGVVAFGAAMISGSVLGAIGYVIAGRVAFPQMRISPRLVSLSALRPLARFSSWVFVARINGAIWRQMDKVILAIVLSSAVLTGYEVASRIQGAAAFALSFTASAVVPAAANLTAAGSQERLRDLLLRGTRYAMAVSLPVTIGAMLLARPLIVGWVGADYADMATATQLFLAYQLVVSASSIANTMLVGMGFVREVTLYATIAVIINLGISIALASPWGVKGVITGTLVGFGITTPLYLRLILRELGLTLGDFIRVTLVPVVPWALAFAVVVEVTKRIVQPNHLVTTVAVCIPGLVVYLIGFGWIGMSTDERAKVFGFLRPVRTDAHADPDQETR